jgi:hypothetical protein
MINFSVERARDHAWKVALDLAPLETTDQMSKIADLDKEIVMLGRKIRHPSLIAGTTIMAIRLGERGTIPQIIDILR